MVTPRGSSSKRNADRIRFERLKRELPVGIYGSFYQDRKKDLLALRDFLRQHGYHNARISEDFDRLQELDPTITGAAYERLLSKLLIDLSIAHVFVLPMPDDDEPANLAQSVSMEVERLNTRIEDGVKDHQEVTLLIQEGFTDCVAGSAGSVCKGLIAEREGEWDIEYYEQIETTFRPTLNFCYRCVEKLWDIYP